MTLKHMRHCANELGSETPMGYLDMTAPRARDQKFYIRQRGSVMADTEYRECSQMASK
jgi:hypothetical protein